MRKAKKFKGPQSNKNRPSMQGCPPMLEDFVRQVLKWHPQERLSAASASLHSFVTSPPLSVSLGLGMGKHGLGTILSGDLDDELLDYLQQCPTWESLDFAGNRPIGSAGKKFRIAREYVCFSDPDKPPKTRNLNNESKGPPLTSHRLACFVKALRVGVTPARK